MKKMLLVLGVAAAAMTSCTSDEVLEMNPTNAIKFESFVNKGTRAVTDVNNPTDAENPLRKFHVYGSRQTTENSITTNIGVWDGNVNTVSSTNGTDWSNGKEEKWADGTYSFAAYANGANSESIATGVFYDNDNQTLTIENYTVDSSKDLVGAFVQNPSKYVTVPLTFKHLLTKVSFEFSNNYDKITGATMNITNLRVTGALPEGTCTLNEDKYNKISTENATTDTWGASGTSENREYASEDDTRIEKNNKYSDSHLFIPQSLDGIKVSFTVSYYDGSSLIVRKDYENVSLKGSGANSGVTHWLPGFHYKYTAYLPVSPENIVFSVTPVEGWKDSTVPDTDPNGEPVKY